MAELREALVEEGVSWDAAALGLLVEACAMRDAHTLEDAPVWGGMRESDALSLVRSFARLHLSPEASCAGLLVAPVAARLLEVPVIEAAMGKDIARLCQKVTKLPSFSLATGKERKERSRHREQVQAQAESFRRMLLAISQDLRVVLLHLAIRVHQLRQLAYVDIADQQALAREGREICAPLANRLGISWLKNEFEDLSLRYLYPHAYYKLASQLRSKKGERDTYINEVKGLLLALVESHGIDADVVGRSKHINSIYRKLERRGMKFEQLFDITAFRVICQTQEQCYQILGLLHARWTPVPGRFKDYIALPKSNQYQSLHTTVVGPQNKRMEVQVRTADMHRVAEDGIAAHWLYKESGTNTKAEPEEGSGVSEVQWLRSLLHLQDEQGDAQEFMANVQDHLFEEKVFAFTPKGDVRELMRGATPLDFAYAIHTEVGMRCHGSKVNGKMVALRYELKNGDMVEILTSPSAQPNHGHLEFAKTGRALTKIRSFLRSTQRQEAVVLGRSRLEKALPSSHKSLNKLYKSGAMAEAAQHFGWSTIDELLMQVGYEKLGADAVIAVLYPKEQAPVEEEEVIDLLEKPPKPKISKGGILVDGMSDILVRMARCCNPIPGDMITGFVSRGRGVSIHTAACPKVQELDEARQIDVRWDDSRNTVHTVTLRIISENRPGLLTHISRVFSDRDINITSARCQASGDLAVNLFQCQVSDVVQLQRLSQQLERIRGVEKVERLRR